jgi:hypothetical protein
MICARSQIDPGSDTAEALRRPILSQAGLGLGEARLSTAYRPSRKPLTYDLGQFF